LVWVTPAPNTLRRATTRFVRDFGGQFRAAGKFFGELAEIRVGDEPVRVLKPTTFMNRSGQAVCALTGFYRIPAQQVMVVHDEIDLPPGLARLKQGGGDGGHRGLRDIIPGLGKNFMRLRLGVGRPEHSADVIDYVLKRPRAQEQTLIDDAMSESLRLAQAMVAGETAQVMNTLNRRAESAIQ
jgi:PTH1 family peptidyl-tRNA hydrolase